MGGPGFRLAGYEQARRPGTNRQPPLFTRAADVRRPAAEDRTNGDARVDVEASTRASVRIQSALILSRRSMASMYSETNSSTT